VLFATHVFLLVLCVYVAQRDSPGAREKHQGSSWLPSEVEGQVQQFETPGSKVNGSSSDDAYELPASQKDLSATDFKKFGIMKNKLSS